MKRKYREGKEWRKSGWEEREGEERRWKVAVERELNDKIGQVKWEGWGGLGSC